MGLFMVLCNEIEQERDVGPIFKCDAITCEFQELLSFQTINPAPRNHPLFYDNEQNLLYRGKAYAAWMVVSVLPEKYKSFLTEYNEDHARMRREDS